MSDFYAINNNEIVIVIRKSKSHSKVMLKSRYCALVSLLNTVQGKA